MSISLKQQAELSNCIKLIFSSSTKESILGAVKNTVNALKSENFFAELPPFYENFSIERVEDILSWHQEIKDDDEDESLEEGHLKELYGLLSAANQRMKELL